MPVVSFPSENVPAPPSPNWTLELVSSSPVFQKCSTSRVLSSTLRPRSNTTGRAPASASMRAANMPHGPKPTMTGRSFSSAAHAVFVTVYEISGACTRFTPFIFSAFASSACSSSTSKSTVYMNFISGFFLASVDSFTMRQLLSLRSLILSAFLI